MFQGIDLGSDTATRPTTEMKQAMFDAPLGDEQMGEDPTTLALEEKVAKLLGFSAAMFLPTATLSNQMAIRLHCQPGDELLAARDSHLYFAEAGGFAVHSGVVAKPLRSHHGIFEPTEVEAQVTKLRGPHFPVSKLLSVENTTNMGGGFAWPLDKLQAVLEVGKGHGLKTHLDGSRFFNASIATGLDARTLARGFDTVTLCLSKGLGCPSGAVLAYNKKDFSTLRRYKQLMGGALRQSGILAASGIFALDHHIDRLREDHDNAQRLYEHLSALEGIEVEAKPQTNMLFFSLKSPVADAFGAACLDKGLRFSHVGPNRFRAVTHRDVSAAQVDQAASIVKDILN